MPDKKFRQGFTGLLLQQEERGKKHHLLLRACSPRGSNLSLYGGGVGVCPGYWGGLGDLPTPLVVWCAVGMPKYAVFTSHTLFLLQASQKWQLGFWSLCIFCPEFAPTAHACVHGCLDTQSCPTLCDPLGCSPPGSSVHGILQARILEWVAMPSSRGSSRPGN